MRCLARLWLALAFCLGLPPLLPAQERIAGVRVGFPVNEGTDKDSGRTYYKAGAWTPVRVQVRPAGPGAGGGRVVVETSDSDDVLNRYTTPIPLAARGPGREPLTVTSYTKPGCVGATITVTAVDAQGHSHDYRGDRGWEALDFAKQIYLTAGSRPADLPHALLGLETDPRKGRTHHAVFTLHADELPTRWFGYQGVDLLILTTGDRDFLNQLLADREGRGEALAGWVRRGGRLVVSVAPKNKNLNQVADLLEKWEPPLTRVLTRDTVSLNRLDGFVQFAEAHGKPFEPSAGAERLTVAKLRVPREEADRVEVLAQEEETHPLLVRVPYGLGSVSLLAIDLDTGPFPRWAGHLEFWQRLVSRLGPRAVAPTANPNSLLGSGENDVATDLQRELEVFDVRPVPFGLVAFLIFLFILAVGPLDYFFLKKVVKRFYWTWATFLLAVVAVSLLAYFGAASFGRHDLHINQVSLVDIDQAGPQPLAHLTTWFTLYSPRLQTGSVDLEPSPGWAEREGRKGPAAPVLVSWLGRPEYGGLNSTGRQRAEVLFRAAYDYDPAGSGLSGIPLAYASTKSFTASWEARFPRPLAGRLRYDPTNPDRISGNVVNRLPAELRDAALMYAGKWYTFAGPLGPGQAAAVNPAGGRDFDEWLNDSAAKKKRGPRTFDATRIVKNLLFFDKLNQGENHRNNQLRHLDQSLRIGTRVAFLYARLPRLQGKAGDVAGQPASPNRLRVRTDGGGPAAEGNLTQDTYIRVVLPVAPGRGRERE